MAAGNSNFYTITNPAAVNGTYTAAGGVSFTNDFAEVKALAGAGYATAMDFTSNPVPGLAGAGYAKGAGVVFTFSGSTPITLNVAAIAAATGVVIGGDTSFALANRVFFQNTGAVDLSWAPGASNGLTMGVSAVNSQVPSVVIPAAVNGVSGKYLLESPTGYTVNATNKNITITPSAGGTLLLTIGGS